jgi:hypothetical protein
VSVLIFACAITRTCIGLAITSFLTHGAITATMAEALPVASTTDIIRRQLLREGGEENRDACRRAPANSARHVPGVPPPRRQKRELAGNENY